MSYRRRRKWGRGKTRRGSRSGGSGAGRGGGGGECSVPVRPAGVSGGPRLRSRGRSGPEVRWPHALPASAPRFGDPESPARRGPGSSPRLHCVSPPGRLRARVEALVPSPWQPGTPEPQRAGSSLPASESPGGVAAGSAGTPPSSLGQLGVETEAHQGWGCRWDRRGDSLPVAKPNLGAGQ